MVGADRQSGRFEGGGTLPILQEAVGETTERDLLEGAQCKREGDVAQSTPADWLLLQEEPWFKEKYDPFVSEQLQNEKLAEVRKIAEKFFSNFSNGVFEKLSLDIT